MALPKITKLSNNENHDFDVIAVWDYTAIADNATSSNQVTIGQVPAYGGVEKVVVAETVALAGASDITLDVGTTTADPDEYIDALDVDAMTAPVYNTGDLFEAANAGGIDLVDLSNATQDIVCEWNGTVASLTAGEVVIGIKFADLGRFASATNG
jgi:hypothetical protein